MEPPSLPEPKPTHPEPAGASSPSRERDRASAQGSDLEERLRQAQRMAAIGQLASAVAHDFNNIIQAIMGYTSFALEDLPEGSPARSDLEHVLTVSSRGATLVRQLLVLARREGGGRERVDVGEVVNDLSKLLRRAVGEHIEFTVAVEGPPHPVNVDRGQLEHALVIAVLSAREAMPDGGRLQLLVRHAPGTASHDHPGEHVELCVADTRSGEVGDSLERQLDPRLPATPGRAPELAEVARFAARHGGFVVSNADPQRGAEVRVHIPLAGALTTDAEVPHEFGRDTPRVRVLLAEDDEQIRKIALRTLEKAGFSVLAAADGEEALALFKTQPNDLAAALIDVVMPKLSGTALLAELRRLRPDLPVVLTSGYSFGQLGPDETHTVLLAKPYSPKAMVERLRELVARARVAR